MVCCSFKLPDKHGANYVFHSCVIMKVPSRHLAYLKRGFEFSFSSHEIFVLMNRRASLASALERDYSLSASEKEHDVSRQLDRILWRIPAHAFCIRAPEDCVQQSQPDLWNLAGQTLQIFSLCNAMPRVLTSTPVFSRIFPGGIFIFVETQKKTNCWNTEWMPRG